MKGFVHYEENIKAQQYADYLVPFANLNENQGFIKSQMTEIYQDYEQIVIDHLHLKQVKKHQHKVVVVLGGFLSCIILIVVLYFIKSKQLKTERQEHKIIQAALAGRLKRSNAALKKEKAVFHEKNTHPIIADSCETEYVNEPICQHILAICFDEKKPIKSSISVSMYADLALTQTQKAQLKAAAHRHYGWLFEKLKADYPELKDKDYLYCYLSLLGLDNSQIAVMTQLSYRTVWER